MFSDNGTNNSSRKNPVSDPQSNSVRYRSVSIMLGNSVPPPTILLTTTIIQVKMIIQN